MKVQWYEESEGIVSCMRIIVMIGTVVGVIVTIAGTWGWMFLKMPDGITVAGLGIGLIGLCIGGKWLQAKTDNETTR